MYKGRDHYVHQKFQLDKNTRKKEDKGRKTISGSNMLFILNNLKNYKFMCGSL